MKQGDDRTSKCMIFVATRQNHDLRRLGQSKNMKKTLNVYVDGWWALLKCSLNIGIWTVLVFLPVYAFQLLLPDFIEGKASGSMWVKIAATICVLLWAPLAAGGLGPLRFQKTENKGDRQQRQAD